MHIYIYMYMGDSEFFPNNLVDRGLFYGLSS